MKCPLIDRKCCSPNCMFTDEAGDCLIKQALQCYVNAERTRVAEEPERVHKETELMETYWPLTTPYIPPGRPYT